MGKLVLILIFISLSTQALVPKKVLKTTEESISDRILGKAFIDNVKITEAIDDKIFDRLINDPKDRVSSTFKVPKYFYHSTKFWFYIYTKYPGSSVVIHDKNQMNIIYEVIEFDHLKSKIKNSYERYLYQNKLVSKEIKLYKQAFKNLSRNRKKGKFEKQIIATLKKQGIKIPKGVKKRRRFYNNLISGIRSQTGQQDKIASGVRYYIPFKATIDYYTKLFDIPRELVAIPFLESSFNIRARSKVGATGIWQFMPYIAKVYMPMDKTIDGRLNPILSTLSAFHLLKQNKRILKQWPLAVAAYNSGPTHFLRARRKLKQPKASLQTILKKYDHPHIGFAAQNFYSEFLALVYALTYLDYFYKDEFNLMKDHKNRIIRPYLTNCRLRPHTFYSKLKNSSPMIKYYNYHFLKKKKVYSSQKIVFSDLKLTSRKYTEVPEKLLTSRYPLNWDRHMKNQRCSIR